MQQIYISTFKADLHIAMSEAINLFAWDAQAVLIQNLSGWNNIRLFSQGA